MSKRTASPPVGGRLLVNVFDGARKPLSGVKTLITVKDGNQTVLKRSHFTKSSVLFAGLPIFSNFGDKYTVLASAKGYRDSGLFPVRIAANIVRSADLMLIPRSARFDFGPARWSELGESRPALRRLLDAGAASAEAAQRRFDDLAGFGGGDVLAGLLNITTALANTLLPQGDALQYLRELDFNRLASDRIYVFADPALLEQVQMAVEHGLFEPAPSALHEGATRSFKQVQFGEANLQITFHENSRKKIGGLNCVLVEPDIDYFRDPGAHTFLEVIPNAFGGITDPRVVYQLRWVAGRHAGVPEFDPLYTITGA